ncbi:MAG TPA: hypothetical protein VHR66_14175 [Gemmataceae bacterium]|nr:hypothetical protein [Gemmataceae bacterium]
MLRTATATVMCLLGVYATTGRCSSPDEIRARADIAQAEEQRYRAYECSTKVTRAGKVVSEVTLQVFKTDGKILVHKLKDDTILCYNKKYMFAIRKAKDSSQWLLGKYAESNAEESFWQEAHNKRAVINFLSMCGQEFRVDEILANPTVRWTPLRRENGPSYRFELSTPGTKGEQQYSGELQLGGSDSNPIPRYSHRTKGDLLVEEAMVREGAAAGGSFPISSIEFVITDVAANKQAQLTRYEFSPLATPAREDEFFLEHYGITPPAGDRPYGGRSTRIWLPIALLGAAAVVIGLWVLRRRQKRHAGE